MRGQLIIKYGPASRAPNASLIVQTLSRFLIAFLKRNASKNKFQQMKNITYKILSPLVESRAGAPAVGWGTSAGEAGTTCVGVGFAFSGRVYGAQKAASFKMLFGSVPFNTLDAHVDYSSVTQKTRNGTWGFRTWLHLRPNRSYVAGLSTLL